MSELRTRASEIYERGVAERGNFTPTGVPLRMYNFWARHAKNVPARENFCHFWRVVFFWSTFMAIRLASRKVDSFLESHAKPLIIVAIVAYVGLSVFLFTGTVSAVIMGGLMLGIPALALGLACSIGLIADKDDERHEPLVWLGAIIGFPISLLVLAGVGVYLGLHKIRTDYWRSSWNKYFVYSLFGVLGLSGAGIIVALIIGLISSAGVIGLLWAGLGLLGVVGLIAGLATLANYISGRRAMAKDRRKFEQREAANALGVAVYEYREMNPPLMLRICSGAADFLILAFQVIRTKKWKICPIVEISSQDEAA